MNLFPDPKWHCAVWGQRREWCELLVSLYPVHLSAIWLDIVIGEDVGEDGYHFQLGQVTSGTLSNSN